jgi:hypothetical protein
MPTCPRYIHDNTDDEISHAALITFKSFTDYNSAEAHKTQLDRGLLLMLDRAGAITLASAGVVHA